MYSVMHGMTNLQTRNYGMYVECKTNMACILKAAFTSQTTAAAVSGENLSHDNFSASVLSDYSSLDVAVDVSIDNKAWWPDLGSVSQNDHHRLTNLMQSDGFDVVSCIRLCLTWVLSVNTAPDALDLSSVLTALLSTSCRQKVLSTCSQMPFGILCYIAHATSDHVSVCTCHWRRQIWAMLNGVPAFLCTPRCFA